MCVAYRICLTASESSLEDDVASDTSGYFKRILVALLAAQRPEPTEQQLKEMQKKGVDSFIDKRAAEEDAKKLYDAGEKWVSVFIYQVDI